MKAFLFGWGVSLLLTMSVVGQQIEDSSGSKIDIEALEPLFATVRSELLDGQGARFASLSQTEKAVCGTINGKNAFGAYTGYRRFMFTLEDNRLSILEPPGHVMHKLQVMAFRYGPCPTW